MITLALCVGACDADEAVVPGGITCHACHGSDANAGPPVSLDEQSETTALGVGAHQAHLTDSAIRRAIACGECHVVPETVEAPGHVDPLPAEVSFGPLSRTDTATPSWDRATGTCHGVYCHGATLAGGLDSSPNWTRVDGSQARCQSCHGAPPPPPHPEHDRCAACHGATVASDGRIAVERELHINGRIDLDVSCEACHGGDGSPAPPADLAGEHATSARGVGAHRSHLASSTWRASVACSACHVVPDRADAPGHIDSPRPAELVFEDRARLGGLAPVFDGDRCSEVYCHGATLTGGTITSPIWAQVDGSQAACGTCHGLPPAPPHLARPDCVTCHADVIAADRAFIRPELHLNGKVDLSIGCGGCHGSNRNPAPPIDLSGAGDTSARGVGAHQSHLGPSSWHAPVECGECHLVPEEVTSPGHRDTPPPAELVFGARATRRGSAPSFDGSSCRDVYCHGARLSGGYNTTPDWTRVDGSQAACGSCHSLPPAGDHPARRDCSACHGMVVSPTNVFVAPERHVDGTVDVGAACDVCHGSAGDPSPPLSVSGETEASARGVGAHRSHLADSLWRAQIACSECHIIPAAPEDPGHLDSGLPAELTFGARASAGGVSPLFDGLRCAVYCHGVTLAGGTNPQPLWTLVDGTQAACGTCHAVPPPSPHPVPVSGGCGPCHPFNGFMPSDPSTHINGTLEVSAACDSCHGSNGNPAPPRDTAGNVGTSARGVGAHRSHLASSTWRAAVQCGNCHRAPTRAPDAGHYDTGLPAELTFSGTAVAGGARPTFNGTRCNDVYCHGATLAAGGTNQAPAWTRVDGTQADCGTCHGVPPASPHPAVFGTTCGPCHPFTGRTANDPSTHVNGTLEVSSRCGDCHDIPPDTGAHRVHYGSAATPPLATYGDLRVLEDYSPSGNSDYAFGCGNCHPIDPAEHMNGVTDVDLYDPAAPAGRVKARNAPTARYAGGACSDVYCHSSGQAEPTFVSTPRWSDGHLAADKCAACHENPPRYPSGGVGSSTANSHVMLSDYGGSWEMGHFNTMGHVEHGASGPRDGGAPLTCQACHYETVDPANTGPSGFWYLDTTGNYSAGGSRNYSCVSCHTGAAGQPPQGVGAVLPLRHVNGRRDVVFDPRTAIPDYPGLPTGPNRPIYPYWLNRVLQSPPPSGSAYTGSCWSLTLAGASYDATTQTCSTVPCHLRESYPSSLTGPLRWGLVPVGMATCNQCHQF